MGQTVVFTVSLDADHVDIGQTQPRPPRRALRDAALTAWRDPHWRYAALAVLAVPALAAGVTALVTGGAWVTTVLLVAAAVVTMASGAWAAARPATGAVTARLAAWLVSGAAGLVLGLVSLPGVILAAVHEQWRGQAALATVTVLALTGAAGAWLGLSVASLVHQRLGPRPRGLAALAALALVLVPLALAAALLPQTRVDEQIVAHTFTTDYVGGMPAYICGSETVEVSRTHTENVAWMALVSPMAWVVDAPSFTVTELAFARQGTAAKAQAWVRSTRWGPDSFTGYCFQPTSLGPPTAVKEARYEGVTPVGARVAMSVAAVLGAAALGLTLRRRQSS